jgi:hypothetical protein
MSNERIEVRKSDADQAYHYVHIAGNGQVMETSENLENHSYALQAAVELGNRLGVPVTDETQDE